MQAAWAPESMRWRAGPEAPKAMETWGTTETLCACPVSLCCDVGFTGKQGKLVPLSSCVLFRSLGPTLAFLGHNPCDVCIMIKPPNNAFFRMEMRDCVTLKARNH